MPDEQGRATRLVFCTGKGGSGVTTVAAATAAHGAQRGLRTLILSLGALGPDNDADDLPAILDHQVGTVPTQIDDLLFAQRFAAQPAFEEWYGKAATRFRAAVETFGVSIPDAAELAAPPGAAEPLALNEINAAVTGGAWDLVVVDGPPLGPALRLLALPTSAETWLRRARPVEGQAARALRPMLATLAGLPLPQNGLVELAEDAARRAAATHATLSDPLSSVRLIATPDTVPIARLRAARTALALYGLRLDGLVINRQILEAPRDSWSRGWSAAQRIATETLTETFAGVPVHEIPYRPCEPLGLEELAVVAAAAYGAGDGLGPAAAAPSPVLTGSEGGYTLVVPLPAADRRGLGLVRRGDDLILTAGAYRRTLPLQPVLRRCRVASAVLRDQALNIRFVPDPELWPEVSGPAAQPPQDPSPAGGQP
ncbi:ArsA family ATPase [Actinocrinis sp.]|uniref:ArsA family ATPase n=1 Tax=Actinocrinis sp. TaxID=1920516 RepID=UPI002DDD3D9E|nr:ArsA-related P-loop ATPase [Actinocrinis sp.]